MLTSATTSHTAAASGAAPSVGLVLLLILVAIGVLLAVRRARLHRLVADASTALHGLAALNDRSRAGLEMPAALRHSFHYGAASKAKYDRFDLTAYLSTCVLDEEAFFGPEIARRVRPLRLHRDYRASIDRLAEQLGSSGDGRIDAQRFGRVEARLFHRRQLPQPRPHARVVAQVSYTSPQGRNAYSRRVEWSFDDLQQGLEAAQALRAQRSTAQAMRARERSLMNDRLRMTVLRRDEFRCRMCGAARNDGATLHVDHITPVSRGGRTVVENLQILCAPCNLGKSNTFIG